MQEPSKERKYAFYEHRLYLIMGEENKMLPNASGTLKLRGYYDLARVQRGGNGLVENQTYPILFERPPKRNKYPRAIHGESTHAVLSKLVTLRLACTTRNRKLYVITTAAEKRVSLHWKGA